MIFQDNSSQNNNIVGDSRIYAVEVDDPHHFTPASATVTLPNTQSYGACVTGNCLLLQHTPSSSSDVLL